MLILTQHVNPQRTSTSHICNGYTPCYHKVGCYLGHHDIEKLHYKVLQEAAWKVIGMLCNAIGPMLRLFCITNQWLLQD
jgi:hypothetical protein